MTWLLERWSLPNYRFGAEEPGVAGVRIKPYFVKQKFYLLFERMRPVTFFLPKCSGFLVRWRWAYIWLQMTILFVFSANYAFMISFALKRFRHPRERENSHLASIDTIKMLLEMKVHIPISISIHLLTERSVKCKHNQINKAICINRLFAAEKKTSRNSK